MIKTKKEKWLNTIEQKPNKPTQNANRRFMIAYTDALAFGIFLLFFLHISNLFEHLEYF